MAIVYITTNKINGRKYLGKSAHGKAFYLGSGIALAHAIKKYGKDSFRRNTLCVVETKEEAGKIEKALSFAWNVVNDPLWYNMKLGGDGGSVKGLKRSAKTCQKIGESRRGRPSWNAGLKGKADPRCAHSDDWKINHGKKVTGKRRTQETRNLMREKAILRTDGYIVTSPTGESTSVRDMKKFCQLNQLHRSAMCMVAKGKRYHHKGWKARYA